MWPMLAPWTLLSVLPLTRSLVPVVHWNIFDHQGGHKLCKELQADRTQMGPMLAFVICVAINSVISTSSTLKHIWSPGWAQTLQGITGRQDPDGPHVGPLNFVICVAINSVIRTSSISKHIWSPGWAQTLQGITGRQDPDGPHVGPLNFVICVAINSVISTSSTLKHIWSPGQGGHKLCKELQANRTQMGPMLAPWTLLSVLPLTPSSVPVVHWNIFDHQGGHRFCKELQESILSSYLITRVRYKSCKKQRKITEIITLQLINICHTQFPTISWYSFWNDLQCLQLRKSTNN